MDHFQEALNNVYINDLQNIMKDYAIPNQHVCEIIRNNKRYIVNNLEPFIGCTFKCNNGRIKILSKTEYVCENNVENNLKTYKLNENDGSFSLTNDKILDNDNDKIINNDIKIICRYKNIWIYKTIVAKLYYYNNIYFDITCNDIPELPLIDENKHIFINYDEKYISEFCSNNKNYYHRIDNYYDIPPYYYVKEEKCRNMLIIDKFMMSEERYLNMIIAYKQPLLKLLHNDNCNDTNTDNKDYNELNNYIDSYIIKEPAENPYFSTDDMSVDYRLSHL